MNTSEIRACRNPANGYEEEISSLTWLWVFLFGTLYFIYKGIWTHAILSLIAAMFTLGFSWLIYPFFGRKIVILSYAKKGWEPVFKLDASKN